MIIFRVASTDFTVPVERETYFVQLLAVAVDIVDGSDSLSLIHILYFSVFLADGQFVSTKTK